MRIWDALHTDLEGSIGRILFSLIPHVDLGSFYRYIFQLQGFHVLDLLEGVQYTFPFSRGLTQVDSGCLLESPVPLLCSYFEMIVAEGRLCKSSSRNRSFF